MQRWLDFLEFSGRHGDDFLPSPPPSVDSGRDAVFSTVNAALQTHISGLTESHIAPIMRLPEGTSHGHVGIDTMLNYDEGLVRPCLFHDVLYTPPSMQHLFDFIT